MEIIIVLFLEDFLIDFVAFSFEVSFFAIEFIEGFSGGGHVSFCLRECA
jgi:hypothetical protein